MASLKQKLSKRIGAWTTRSVGTTTELSIHGTVTVGEAVVRNLTPLGGYHRLGITKAGRFSCKGLCNGATVKVYSTFSERQTRLRREIQNLQLPGCGFADIVATDGQLVVERWVDGTPVASLTGTQMQEAARAVAELMESLVENRLTTAIAEKYQDAFCYLQDYLLPRLQSWALHDQIAQLVIDWRAEYQAVGEQVPARISHPDLSTRNIMREPDTGRFVVIDNELVGVGRGWIIDWHNSLLNKLGFDRPHYLAQVPHTLIERTWTLRRLGAALERAKTEIVNEIIDECFGDHRTASGSS